MEERKGFGSNFGFLMAAVGSAVAPGCASPSQKHPASIVSTHAKAHTNSFFIQIPPKGPQVSARAPPAL